MNLSDLQKAFAHAITGKSNPQLIKLIQDGPAMSAADKLAVYRNNARIALVYTLEQIYPACRQTLGKDYFRQAARAYIKRHPSRTADLNDYGGRLPDFLAELTKTRAELDEYAYLPELARLEYACHTVYYAADDTPFDFQAFERCDKKEAARFMLPTAMCLLQSDYPVLAIWEVLRQQSEQGGRENKEENVVVTGSGFEYLCVRRVDGLPRVERVDEARYALLTAIKSGCTLGELAGDGEKFGKLDTTLPELIANGWISAFRPGSRSER